MRLQAQVSSTYASACARLRTSLKVPVYAGALLIELCRVQAYKWATVPKTVRELERNLTSTFTDSTALLWGHRTGVIGGTGVLNLR